MYLAQKDVTVYEPSGRPLLWSTDTGGLHFWLRWFNNADNRDHWDWRAGGELLFERIVPALAPERRIPPSETHVISHSHGLQAVLYAASMGLLIDTYIDVSGPIRKDMMKIAEMARPNIRNWIHVHSDMSDWLQILGEFGDGVFGMSRAHPLASLNWKVPKAGHTGVLQDPKWFDSVWGELLLSIPHDDSSLFVTSDTLSR